MSRPGNCRAAMRDAGMAVLPRSCPRCQLGPCPFPGEAATSAPGDAKASQEVFKSTGEPFPDACGCEDCSRARVERLRERQAELAREARRAAVEDEARFVASLAVRCFAATVDGQFVPNGTPEAERLQVEAARRFLAESRRQVGEAQA